MPIHPKLRRERAVNQVIRKRTFPLQKSPLRKQNVNNKTGFGWTLCKKKRKRESSAQHGEWFIGPSEECSSSAWQQSFQYIHRQTKKRVVQCIPWSQLVGGVVGPGNDVVPDIFAEEEPSSTTTPVRKAAAPVLVPPLIGGEEVCLDTFLFVCSYFLRTFQIKLWNFPGIFVASSHSDAFEKFFETACTSTNGNVDYNCYCHYDDSAKEKRTCCGCNATASNR